MRGGKEIGSVSSFFWEEAASHSWPGNVCQEKTGASWVHAGGAVLLAVAEGQGGAGRGPQDFQCLNRIGNRIQFKWTFEWKLKEIKVTAASLQVSTLTCLSVKLILGAWKKKEKSLVGFECFTLLELLGWVRFFFNCKRRNIGIGNAYNGLRYLTSHSPISTENRRVWQ